MKQKGLFVITTVYMGLIGLGFLFAPVMLGFGVVPAGASAALISYLRIPASTFIGIALLNWFARKAEVSTALNAIIIGNIIGFGLGAVLEVFSIFSGNRMFTLVFAFINAVFCIAFIIAKRSIVPVNIKS